MNIIKSVLIAAIGTYQKLISPYLPRSCRFHPSCSAYAAEAIGRYGPWRGLVLSARRLSRCHPWHPGGVDRLE